LIQLRKKIPLFASALLLAGLALRHSFASYHVAYFKDAKALALEMGHTDSGMLFNQYRALVKPNDAERYWNIRPATMENVVPLAAVTQ
jgi:integrase